MAHSVYLAPVNPDWFYLPGFTFIALAHPGGPRQNPRPDALPAAQPTASKH